MVKQVKEKKSKEEERQVDSVDKALVILECFTRGNPELTLKEISELTSLNKSRIIRLCGTLASHRFLYRNSHGAYRLGSKLMVLGRIYEKNNSLVTSARPLLKELATITKEATSLFVSDDFKLLRLLREEGPSLIRFSINENHDLPSELYALAAGKIFLAYGGSELIKKLFDNRVLFRFTPNTITDWEELNKECQKILKQGYAVSNGEHFSEVGAVAMPVFDGEQNLCATIDIAGPIQRFSKKRIQNELQPALKKIVKELSTQLGYTGDHFE